MSKKDAAMATVQILYWYDIPVQVKAVAGRERRSVSLSDRFQEAVDRAAMIVGVIDSDDYTDLYQWGEPAGCGYRHCRRVGSQVRDDRLARQCRIPTPAAQDE
jgi:hypothetical protein